MDRLLAERDERVRAWRRLANEFAKLNGYLAIADDVSEALKQLSDQLFQQLLVVVQEKLSIAYRKFYDQPIRFLAEADFRAAAVQPCRSPSSRDGCREDVMRGGQGGSVANIILSVDCRHVCSHDTRSQPTSPSACAGRARLLVAARSGPQARQDRPRCRQSIGFQVIMISHHDIAVFEQYADKIFQFVPTGGGAVQCAE